MLLGFKRRFEPYVLDGSKRYTIRAFGNRRPFQVGDTCDCYGDSRQKTMHLLGRWPCVRVESIHIYECGDGRFSVIIDRHELTPDEKDGLAWRDGFRSYTRGAFIEMIEFWMKEHGDGTPVSVTRHNYRQGEPFVAAHGKPLDFEGQLIHWDYNHPVTRR